MPSTLDSRQFEPRSFRLASVGHSGETGVADQSTAVGEDLDRTRRDVAALRAGISYLKQQGDLDRLAFARAFVGLLGLKAPIMSEHCRRTADLAFRLAKFLRLCDEDCDEIFVAALVHDVGSVGMSDRTYTRSTSFRRADERAAFVQHPVLGELLLMPIHALRHAARLVRSHHERWDGKGFPDQRAGEDTPLGARIIAIADDFDRVQLGVFHGRTLARNEALEYISDGIGTRYGPDLSAAFLEVVDREQAAEAADVVAVRLQDLRPGMTLARDLPGAHGLVLLGKGCVLDEDLIQTLERYADGERVVVYVQRGSVV